MLVSACGDELQTEYVYITPDVPAEMRETVEVRQREIGGLRDVGLVLADHVEALETANSRISGVDCILRAAEENRTATICAKEKEPK